MQDSAPHPLQQLFDLIATLRAPDGCPWDRAQKLEDILADTIEEAYELAWAGTHLGDAEVLDEMGDLLFLLCFSLVVKAESTPGFTLERVARHAYDKIYRRHPHVFGEESASTPEESIVHWERIKAEERAEKEERGGAGGTLAGLPGNLPPLRRAEKVQKRAASVGFDWEDTLDIVAKLREEADELEEAIRSGQRDAVQHELGDLFFSAVNVARFLEIDADAVLASSTSKFVRRFERMEAMIHADGKRLPEMTLAEMDAYWNRVKKLHL